MSRLNFAIEQIAGARKYTRTFIDGLEPLDWFRMPQEGVTHIAWQVAHLAVAQYRLCLERVCGVNAIGHLMPEKFLAAFSRDSVPDPDPSRNPSPDEIRSIFDRVHVRLLTELPSLPDRVLDEPAGKPHPVFSTKIGALHWCAMHEMVHAGQIALLRRLLGQKPLW